jgi:hypothetical protein
MKDEDMKDYDLTAEGRMSADAGGAVSDAEHGGLGDLGAARGNSAAIAQQMAGGGHTLAAEHEAGTADGVGAFAGVLIDGFRVPEVLLARKCMKDVKLHVQSIVP